MKAYIDIIKHILENGDYKENRTGVDTYSVPGMMFEHDTKNGFPLLTTKKVPFKLIASELEFFIKGLTDKKWLQERNNHIWDEWCNPQKVPYSHDKEIQQKMKEETDLGPVYGYQWRNFGKIYGTNLQGFDQLKWLINRIKTNPNCRRMIVSAWNPPEHEKMALLPCHYGFQILINNNKLNLLWNQRSVDTALGLPFNIASYALLQHLISLETGYKTGKLIGFLADTHIYVNHINGLKEQISRSCGKLPTIETENFTSIFDWKYTDSQVKNYNPHSSIKFDIAI